MDSKEIAENIQGIKLTSNL